MVAAKNVVIASKTMVKAWPTVVRACVSFIVTGQCDLNNLPAPNSMSFRLPNFSIV